MSHYYKTDDSLKDQDITIDFEFENQSFRFRSNSGIFSKSAIDKGSRALLDYLVTQPLSGALLDIGCGYGLLGIVLKKVYPCLEVTLADVNRRAVETTKLNAQVNQVEGKVIFSDLYSAVSDSYDWIISNPPIRAGKDVVYKLIEEAREHMTKEGKLVLVIRKDQGALSALRFCKEIYRTAEIVAKRKGYCIIRIES